MYKQLKLKRITKLYKIIIMWW